MGTKGRCWGSDFIIEQLKHHFPFATVPPLAQRTMQRHSAMIKIENQ